MSWKEHGWLYAMLLTTLIPTLIHFLVASFSLILVVSRKVLRKWAANLDRLIDNRNRIILATSHPQANTPVSKAPANQPTDDSDLKNSVATYLTLAWVVAAVPLVLFIYGLNWFVKNGYHGSLFDFLLNGMIRIGALFDPMVATGCAVM